MIKRILISLYIALIIVMAVATFVEKYEGTEFVSDYIYGSWWFILLWAVGVALGIVYFLKSKVRKWNVITLHLSFVIMLCGAFITHFTAKRGVIHLRHGVPTSQYSDSHNSVCELGFSVSLIDFQVKYHEGTEAPEDYVSTISITRGNNSVRTSVSMNNIYNAHGARLYQSGFDPDMKGAYLSVNSDVYGIPVSYTGYALLFFSLVWLLVDSSGTFRTTLRRLRASSSLAVAFLISVSALFWSDSAKAQTTFSKEDAAEFCRLYVVYNDRVCPLETFAIDFTKKLYGRSSYKEFTAAQVLAGFVFYSDEWMKQPIIKLKRGALRSSLNLDSYVSPASFFSNGKYILGRYLNDGINDEFHKQVLDIDDRLMLIIQMRKGETLKLFPYSFSGKDKKKSVVWYSPSSALPASMPEAQQQYVRNILSVTQNVALSGDNASVREAIYKLKKYQLRYGATSLPSMFQTKAESINNSIPFATVLFMFNLTLAFLSLAFINRKRIFRLFNIAMAASFLVLSFAVALRWVVGGNLPMNNGYETTIVLAWFIMLVALLASRYLNLMTTFGLLMSGFMLLVSHIGQMDPAITHRMPVLNSRLLSIHVSVIMMAYACLSLTFVLSLSYWIRRMARCIMKRHEATGDNSGNINVRWAHKEAYLSQAFLYPAMVLLGIGIWVGAIWANISWGSYWSWDPKETWALITFMVYAVPMHKSVTCFRDEGKYHAYMLLAWGTVAMTYWGVNYLLGGMHSYA